MPAGLVLMALGLTPLMASTWPSTYRTASSTLGVPSSAQETATWCHSPSFRGVLPMMYPPSTSSRRALMIPLPALSFVRMLYRSLLLSRPQEKMVR